MIPAEWKKTKVAPLYKSGSKDDPIISYHPAYIQVFECLIHKQLASYFYECNLLYKSQSGFKRMHSTDGCNLFRQRDSLEYG